MTVVHVADGTQVGARAIIIATGARYRRLALDGLADLEGTGVYYAATPEEASRHASDAVAVVGGGNSAGQAAIFKEDGDHPWCARWRRVHPRQRAPSLRCGGRAVTGEAARPSNWGRWGADDERGTLNLITDEVRSAAVAEARTGRVVSLSRPVPAPPLAAGPMAALAAPSVSAMQAAMYTGAGPRALAELLIIMTHSPELTHFDSLAHQVLDGQVYPGRPLGDSADAAGVRHGSTVIFAGGVVTRGVFLDPAPGGAVPEGYGVTGADVDEAATCGGAGVRAGDVIVVRGGWDYAASHHLRLPGITLDAVAWMHDHDVAVYAGDIGDAHPPIDPAVGGALHRVALPRPGMPLIDVADPTALAAASALEGRSTFLFVAAPLRLGAASGVPVNPLAIF